MFRLTKVIFALILFSCAWCVSAEPVDINSATADQLAESLNGIGKAKADAIIQDRDKNGKFKSVEDLARVKGIGSATIEKNRDKITVGIDVPSSPAAPPKAK
ncbi:ComEA family DNA-binding protein [Methylocaldum sp.]|uniref:ComEA family DNA-binding protein n=1 Tax=Methylocaldum sp. TaxID=1969727 RepID=UPI002D4F7082|nr:ComEA family DNA-binding protein [Methylocaldum sp.]HYE34539.1 ComEA family DNA-binding protein [Methylocaldum sp.]